MYRGAEIKLIFLDLHYMRSYHIIWSHINTKNPDPATGRHPVERTVKVDRSLLLQISRRRNLKEGKPNSAGIDSRQIQTLVMGLKNNRDTIIGGCFDATSRQTVRPLKCNDNNYSAFQPGWRIKNASRLLSGTSSHARTQFLRTVGNIMKKCDGALRILRIDLMVRRGSGIPAGC